MVLLMLNTLHEHSTLAYQNFQSISFLGLCRFVSTKLSLSMRLPKQIGVWQVKGSEYARRMRAVKDFE